VRAEHWNGTKIKISKMKKRKKRKKKINTD
jgi:hypothetical protein